MGPAATTQSGEGSPRRNRILVGTWVVAIGALAWGYLFYLDAQMARMGDFGALAIASAVLPWTAADAWFTFAMWVMMMAGMMAAPAAPVLLLFASMQGRSGTRDVQSIVACFALGYFAVWVGFSAVATLTQWALHQSGTLLSAEMAVSGSRAGGAILLAAGLYQLTPLKDACLKHCQSPLGFLLTRWRSGKAGAMRMGLAHGAYCVGCCSALMFVLFVVGAMNLLWVAILTGLVLVERIGGAGSTVARVAGVAMIGAGVILLGATG